MSYVPWSYFSGLGADSAACEQQRSAYVEWQRLKSERACSAEGKKKDPAACGRLTRAYSKYQAYKDVGACEGRVETSVDDEDEKRTPVEPYKWVPRTRSKRESYLKPLSTESGEIDMPLVIGPEARPWGYVLAGATVLFVIAMLTIKPRTESDS